MLDRLTKLLACISASRRQGAAVHGQQVTGDHAGDIGREIEHRADQLVRLAHASQRHTTHGHGLILRLVAQQATHVGLEPTGRDGVHADAVLSPLYCKAPCELYDPTFATEVGNGAGQTDLPGNGSEVDDFALPAGDHAPPHFLTAEKDALQFTAIISSVWPSTSLRVACPELVEGLRPNGIAFSRSGYEMCRYQWLERRATAL